MTLTKARPRRATPAHRKRSAAHHKRSDHYLRPYWPYLPVIAVLVFGLLFNSWYGKNHGVLGYATDMSATALLNDTNQQRVANGLGSLALNSLLSQAAQAKANDMASRDYWSHNTPDGKTPWTFIVATGYNYQTAGENLAYGFTTASDAITGWMNSPEHRANILNTTFQQVGFGVANAANYQGTGPETVVVAMYAEPVVAAAPAPVATAPTPVSSTAKPPETVATTVPAASNTASGISGGGTPSDTPTTQTTNTATSPKTSTATAVPAPNVAQTHDVSRVQLLAASNVAWSQFAVSLLVSIALLAFLLRHSFAWHKVLAKGERFVVHHPLLDVVFALVIVAGVYLLQTVGTIR